MYVQKLAVSSVLTDAQRSTVEWGSFDPQLSGFVQMPFMGTTNESVCLTEFDQADFILGMSSDFLVAFNSTVSDPCSVPAVSWLDLNISPCSFRMQLPKMKAPPARGSNFSTQVSLRNLASEWIRALYRIRSSVVPDSSTRSRRFCNSLMAARKARAFHFSLYWSLLEGWTLLLPSMR